MRERSSCLQPQQQLSAAGPELRSHNRLRPGSSTTNATPTHAVLPHSCATIHPCRGLLRHAPGRRDGARNASPLQEAAHRGLHLQRRIIVRHGVAPAPFHLTAHGSSRSDGAAAFTAPARLTRAKQALGQRCMHLALLLLRHLGTSHTTCQCVQHLHKVHLHRYGMVAQRSVCATKFWRAAW